MRRLPLVSPLDRAVFLKAQGYLEGLRPQVVAALAEHTDERELAEGERLFEPGVPPREVFFLSTGGVRIDYATGASFELAAPAGIGLMEHLARSPHPPAVAATAPMQALAIDVEDFMQIVEDDFDLQMTIAGGMGRTILELQERLGSKRPAERGFVDAHRRRPQALDLVQRLAVARDAPLFEGSNLTVLTELLRFQEPRPVAPDEILWRTGDPVGSMALVLDGSFVAAGTTQENAYPAGSTLGVWEIFGSERRRESARATEPSRIVEIDRTHFTDVLEDHFEFVCDVLGKAARTAIALRLHAAGLAGAGSATGEGPSAEPGSGSRHGSGGRAEPAPDPDPDEEGRTSP